MEKNISRTPFYSISFPIIFIILISKSCFNNALTRDPSEIGSRQVLEIGIGIGGSSPPAFPPDNGDCPDCNQPPEPPCPEPAPPPPPQCPPPPPSPPPPSPPPTKKPPSPPPTKKPPSPPRPPPNNFPDGLSAELRQNIEDIQRFRKRITSDPFHVTDTWKGNNICKDQKAYRGFVCDTTKDTNETKIAGIKFNGFNLGGNNVSLAYFIGQFTSLIFFHANTNNFKGGVPAEFNKLKTLYEFDMSNNKLSGGFPKPVLAGNLTFLDLRFNYFTGPVPPQAFTLDLDALFLNNNMFSGPLPNNLGRTPAVYLTLANNYFTGPIPKSISQAGNTLIEVLFLNNQLSGCLPYEVGLLKRTEVFDASGNQLTGPIPSSFGCLQRMERLNLANNHLYRAVPEELCCIKSLDKLTLRSNYFTKVGPQCRALIRKGILDLGMNCIIDLEHQRKPNDCEDFFLNHPRDCPDLLHIPCKIENSATQLSDEPARKKHSKHSRAYAALHRHHH